MSKSACLFSLMIARNYYSQKKKKRIPRQWGLHFIRRNLYDTHNSCSYVLSNQSHGHKFCKFKTIIKIHVIRKVVDYPSIKYLLARSIIHDLKFILFLQSSHATFRPQRSKFYFYPFAVVRFYLKHAPLAHTNIKEKLYETTLRTFWQFFF